MMSVQLGCASLESALAWHSASSARSCSSGTRRPSASLQVALRTACRSSVPASFSCSHRRSHAPSHANSHSHRIGLPVNIKPPAHKINLSIQPHLHGIDNFINLVDVPASSKKLSSGVLRIKTHYEELPVSLCGGRLDKF